MLCKHIALKLPKLFQFHIDVVIKQISYKCMQPDCTQKVYVFCLFDIDFFGLFLFITPVILCNVHITNNSHILACVADCNSIPQNVPECEIM